MYNSDNYNNYNYNHNSKLNNKIYDLIIMVMEAVFASIIA